MAHEIDPVPSGHQRRLVIYLVFDPRGDVDRYVPYKLERLRPLSQRMVVVSNGPLNPAGRKSLEDVADDVWERENVGFDVGAYKWALERLGSEEVARYDEVILMNYTWFGPIGSFEPVFAEMDARDVDFWGMTDHGPVTPNPHTGAGTMPAHIQSHWMAVRKSVLQSDHWARYWAEMPIITSYAGSITHHESRFTEYFESRGFTYSVAFPYQDFPGTVHPAFERAQDLLDAGCPVLKRRIFFHDPLYLDREGIIGRWLIDSAIKAGYPSEILFENLSKNVKPKILNTSASMLEILPEQNVSYDATSPLRIAATVHIFYDEMTDELLDKLGNLPSGFDLFVTTSDDEKAAEITRRIGQRQGDRFEKVEVRVLASNRGRDISAFYIGCRDVIDGEDYDLIVKVHSKKTVQQGSTVGDLFKRQQVDNLLNSPGYAANLIGLFQAEPGLGAVFAPMVHIGFPTLGGAWFTNKHRAKALAMKLGIRVPLDDLSPLAPLGSMFVARPAALALLVSDEVDYDDYSPEGAYGDGSLAHVQERMVAYAAGELGFHCRTVANAEYAAISHTFLEYKLDQLSETVQGDAVEEIHVLRQRQSIVRQLEGKGWLGFQRAYLLQRHPGVARALIPIYQRMMSVVRRSPSAEERGSARW
jgi:lipopolysaccharide biosynthesis protein